LRSFFEKLGAKVGHASPCSFKITKGKRTIKIAVHGDDIVCAGASLDLYWLRAEIHKRFETKVQVLGTGPGQTKQVKVFNRLVSWEKEGITIQADPRHARALIEEMALKKGKGVATPCESETHGKHAIQFLARDAPLCLEEARRFRGLAARLSYLAQDRPDLKVAALYASRCMAAPASEIGMY